MNTKKDDWTLESAMEILQHPTVDSKIWAEAVEWLLLYGPPEIREMLQQASGHAAMQSFPELKVTGFNDKGEPCYDIKELARSLGISEEEAMNIVAEKEQQHGIQQIFSGEETKKPQ